MAPRNYAPRLNSTSAASRMSCAASGHGPPKPYVLWLSGQVTENHRLVLPCQYGVFLWDRPVVRDTRNRKASEKVTPRIVRAGFGFCRPETTGVVRIQTPRNRGRSSSQPSVRSC
jgi:hypothetical protein